MGETTKIEWCDSTWNPWIGCTKVSDGCKHCYAESLNKRTGGGNWGPGAPRRVTVDSYWRQPLKWDREAAKAGVRRKVFCASMADVFDAEAPEGARERLWELIRKTPNLDWLLLTKRPERIRECLPEDWGSGYPNVWLGTTVEDQAAADTRISILLGVPAVVRFLSCEPLIGSVDIRPFLVVLDIRKCWACGFFTNRDDDRCPNDGVPLEGDRRISWVIVGGESGPNARPMHPDWARAVRDQCQDAGIAYFFKQWGELIPYEPSPGAEFLLDSQHGDESERCALPDGLGDQDGPIGGWWLPDLNDEVFYRRVGKKAAGALLDGREWKEFPTPRVPADAAR